MERFLNTLLNVIMQTILCITVFGGISYAVTTVTLMEFVAVFLIIVFANIIINEIKRRKERKKRWRAYKKYSKHGYGKRERKQLKSLPKYRKKMLEEKVKEAVDKSLTPKKKEW